jgi:TonB family protein
LQIGFALAQEGKPAAVAAGPETGPVLLSRSDLENCPNTFVSATRIEGTTRVRALIDPSGQPTEVTVVASSGFQPLDEAAVTCFKKARFQPAVRAGKPVQAPLEMGVKWEIPPGAETCSPSMPIAWIVQVSVRPSPTSPAPDPTPAGATALVCGCADGRDPVILRSSGTSRFDDGAIKLMKKAGEQHGSRVSWCYAEEFRFTPENAAHSEGGP